MVFRSRHWRENNRIAGGRFDAENISYQERWERENFHFRPKKGILLSKNSASLRENGRTDQCIIVFQEVPCMKEVLCTHIQFVNACWFLQLTIRQNIDRIHNYGFTQYMYFLRAHILISCRWNVSCRIINVHVPWFYIIFFLLQC